MDTLPTIVTDWVSFNRPYTMGQTKYPQTPAAKSTPGRARITYQTPSSLQLGTQANPITPEHAVTRAG